ncbi:hypothetical protein [Paraburkholderia graminis]
MMNSYKTYNCWNHVWYDNETHMWQWQSSKCESDTDAQQTFDAYWNSYRWALQYVNVGGPKIERFNTVDTTLEFDSERFGELEDVRFHRHNPFGYDVPHEDETMTSQGTSFPSYIIWLELDDDENEAFKQYLGSQNGSPA